MAKSRPYLFYDTCISICSTCFRKVEGKILIQDDKVLMRRRCPHHGWETVLIADDVEWYRAARESWIKPPEMPLRFNTPIKYGCPYDCGLCPDHEQHSCLSIVEITDFCNLSCPICYADSGPTRQTHRSLALVLEMLDAVVANEGEPDVVQISGGEPTLHPDFFAILDAARERPIRHLMINTNGVRIAQDLDFAHRLASYKPGFEVYLQWDSMEEDALRRLRGEDLRAIRQKALANCETAGLDVTLVCVVQKDLNDHELGDIIELGVASPAVRGVTFQPVQQAGRTDGYNPATDRLTLTEVRRRILEQSPRFTPEDIVPVPCHPDAIAMAYGLKAPLDDGTPSLVPLTSLIPKEVLIGGQSNTISFEKDPAVQDSILKLFATNHSPESQAATFRELLCCLPKLDAPTDWSYDKLFRVIIMQFMDAWSFDVRSVKKSCVHIVDPKNMRLVPFDTFNLFYRDNLEEERLGPIREELERSGLV